VRRALKFAILAALFVYIPVVSAEPQGAFSGRIVAEWLADGRDMRLLEPFGYTSSDGRKWNVPAGAIVDGASIPQFFWSVIGAPFSGAYRDASVIHDYYCDQRNRKFEDVHKVFYEAMLASKISQSKAWIMYQAVERFGPRWADPKIDAKCENVGKDYDFEKCARAASPPKVQFPAVNRMDLQEFSREISGKVDSDDLSALNAAISKLK
jgi:Protein of unknown function (DUF1353)